MPRWYRMLLTLYSKNWVTISVDPLRLIVCPLETAATLIPGYVAGWRLLAGMSKEDSRLGFRIYAELAK